MSDHNDLVFRVHRKRAPANPDGEAVEDPVRFLEDRGILAHINARILHPVGLSLEAKPGGDLALVDHRGRPFDLIPPGEFEEQARRWERFLEEGGAATMATRQESLGFVVQRK